MIPPTLAALPLLTALAAPAEPSRRDLAGEHPSALAVPNTPAPASAPAPAPAPDAAAPPKAEDDASKKKPKEIAVERAKFKPGKGFELSTADGRYALAIRARVQFRYDFEHPNADGETNEHVMQIRRARLQLAGNVFGKHNKYYIQFGFSPRDMTGGLVATEGSVRINPVRDARVEFDYLRDLTVVVGQTKVPFSRQRVISSGNQNMVDRSSVNEEFNLDRDIGVQLRSQDIGGLGLLQYAAGVFLGDGRNAFALGSTGLLYVARFEVQPLGPFSSDSEGDLERTRKPGLSIGAAYAYHDDAPGDRGVHGQVPADGGTTDLHHATADLMFKWRGLSVESAFHLRKARRRNPGGAVDDTGAPIPVAPPRDGLGFFAQVGYLVPRIDLELVTRYSFVRGAFDLTTGLRDRDEVGGGVNYYFFGHNLKLQLDYFRVWEVVPGMTARAAAAEGVDRVRLQLQLAF